MGKIKPVALVAGAGSRLGLPLVKELSKRGYDVVSASRKEPNFGNTAGVKWKQFDITNNDDCLRIVKETVEEHQGVDLLVICSGYYPKVEVFSDQSVDELSLDIDITYKGPVVLSKNFFDENKGYGKGDVVLLSSSGAHLNVLDPRMIVYSSNKAAISRFSENLNEAMKPYGMRSFTVVPWQLSEDTDIEKLKEQNAISYSELSNIIIDMVNYKGNAQVSTVEVKPNFNTDVKCGL